MANGDVAPRIISPGTRWKTVCLTLWPLWVLPAPHDSRLDRLQKRPESFKKKKKENYHSSARKTNYNFLVFQAHRLVSVHSREEATK